MAESVLNDKIIDNYRFSKSLYNHLLKEKNKIESAQSDDVFSGCVNLLGVLGDEQKEMISKYLENPTERLWEEIHSIVIGGFETLWSAWGKVDGNSIKSKAYDAEWESFPDAETLTKAIKKATADNYADVLKDLALHEKECLQLESKYPDLKTNPTAQKDYLADLKGESSITLTLS